jgi:hypothetical protein
MERRNFRSGRVLQTAARESREVERTKRAHNSGRGACQAMSVATSPTGGHRRLAQFEWIQSWGFSEPKPRLRPSGTRNRLWLECTAVRLRLVRRCRPQDRDCHPRLPTTARKKGVAASEVFSVSTFLLFADPPKVLSVRFEARQEKRAGQLWKMSLCRRRGETLGIECRQQNACYPAGPSLVPRPYFTRASGWRIPPGVPNP